ncbi:hypothetical protein CEXT_711981 [Caerostris extrusa]|uniref:Uncharacterized protein n=1 Tax=Caerostris extrusa TaxID=172846 RepID=A0AAV4PHW6_CAEEX|nr:hypothetical protein CEXT_711981 [Caerostris extrusa]
MAAATSGAIYSCGICYKNKGPNRTTQSDHDISGPFFFHFISKEVQMRFEFAQWNSRDRCHDNMNGHYSRRGIIPGCLAHLRQMFHRPVSKKLTPSWHREFSSLSWQIKRKCPGFCWSG